MRLQVAGHHRATGSALRLLVIDVTTVAEIEDDDVRRWFGRRRILRVDTRQWVGEYPEGGDPTMNRPEDLEGYDDWVQKFLESFPPERRLVGLAPEAVLAEFAPEQRLAGLAPDEAILALPDKVLRRLPESFVQGLPDSVHDRIHAWLGS